MLISSGNPAQILSAVFDRRNVLTMKKKSIRYGLVIVLAATLLMTACSKSYVTGKSEFMMVSEEQEIEMGREYDPEVIAQYGLYEDEALAEYVNGRGQEIAKISHRSNLDYTFRLLDSPMVNAFAVPGGYVYITRGILTYMNSEDEFVGVLGHEVAHVVARHSAKQMSRSVVTSGFGLFNVVGSVLPAVGAMLQVPGTLALLSYSREQESESDRLGVEYATRLGYDAALMAGFFETLQRMSEKQEHRPPKFLSTHPDPGDRETEIKRMAGEWQQKIDYKPLDKDPDDFLRMLDGIVYGENPRAGFVMNDMFYHPALAFQLPVPKDWTVLNTPERLAFLNGGKTAGILLHIGKEKEPGIEADLFVKEAKAVVIKRETSSVNGLGAEVVESTVGGGSDQLHLLSYFIKKGEYVYIIHSFTTEKMYPNFVRVFSETSRGFANVSDPDVLNVQPRRVRVRKAPSAGTLKEALLSIGVSEDGLEEASLMNGRTLSARIEKGSLLKIVE